MLPTRAKILTAILNTPTLPEKRKTPLLRPNISNQLVFYQKAK